MPLINHILFLFCFNLLNVVFSYLIISDVVWFVCSFPSETETVLSAEELPVMVESLFPLRLRVVGVAAGLKYCLFSCRCSSQWCTSRHPFSPQTQLL